MLEPFKDILYPVPDMCDIVFELIPSISLASKAAVLAQELHRQSNVGSAMICDFDVMRAPICHDVCPPISEAKATQKRPTAMSHGGHLLVRGGGRSHVPNEKPFPTTHENRLQAVGREAFTT